MMVSTTAVQKAAMWGHMKELLKAVPMDQRKVEPKAVWMGYKTVALMDSRSVASTEQQMAAQWAHKMDSR